MIGKARRTSAIPKTFIDPRNGTIVDVKGSINYAVSYLARVI